MIGEPGPAIIRLLIRHLIRRRVAVLSGNESMTIVFWSAARGDVCHELRRMPEGGMRSALRFGRLCWLVI